MCGNNFILKKLIAQLAQKSLISFRCHLSLQIIIVGLINKSIWQYAVPVIQNLFQAMWLSGNCPS